MIFLGCEDYDVQIKVGIFFILIVSVGVAVYFIGFDARVGVLGEDMRKCVSQCWCHVERFDKLPPKQLVVRCHVY